MNPSINRISIYKPTIVGNILTLAPLSHHGQISHLNCVTRYRSASSLSSSSSSSLVLKLIQEDTTLPQNRITIYISIVIPNQRKWQQNEKKTQLSRMSGFINSKESTSNNHTSLSWLPWNTYRFLLTLRNFCFFFSIWWTCIIWYVSGFVSLIWCVVAYICSIDDLFKFVLAPPLNCHLTRFLFYCHGLKGKWDDYLLVVIKIKGKLPLILMLVGR